MALFKWVQHLCIFSIVAPLFINKNEDYMPRFPISSGAPRTLAGMFTSVQHYLEMLVYYVVTLSYKPVQQSQTHNRWLHCISAGQCFYNDMRFALWVKAWAAPHHSAYNSQTCLSLFAKCLEGVVHHERDHQKLRHYRLYPAENPRSHFIGSCGPQHWSEFGVKKLLHISDSYDQTQALQTFSQAPSR